MLLIPNFSDRSTYIRQGAISLEQGLEYIRLSRFLSQKRRVLMGVDVGFDGNRLATFLYKGVDCVMCGGRGSYFAIERCKGGFRDDSKYHANLWGIRDNGTHFLMTSDHIVPKSKGGLGSMSNRQPMCSPCNCSKGNLMQADFEKRIRRLERRKEGVI